MNAFLSIRRLVAVVAVLLSTALATMGPTASAGFPDPPTPLSTDPVQPFANQVLDVIFTLDGCGDAFPGYLPDNRVVEVSEQVVRITVAHATELCFPGQPTPPSYRWNAGPLAPGTYRIELYGYYHLSDPDDPETLFLLSSGEVTVRPGVSVAPAVVPSGGPAGLVVLMLLVAGVGLLAFASTRADRCST